MELSYGDVERLLMHLHRVPRGRRGAMRSRIQHLQRQGFPRMPPAGRGVRAVYDVDAAFQLVAAFELAQLNWTAQTSTGLIEAWWPSLRPLVDEGLSWAAGGDVPTGLAVISPDALASIRGEVASATVEVVPGELIAAWALRAATLTAPGQIVLDLAGVAREAARFLRSDPAGRGPTAEP